jgi:4-amino-4-deoxy-L-arabinose transferase-like glycosyltransferase
MASESTAPEARLDVSRGETLRTLLALVALAAFLRVIGLGQWGLWADEAATLRDAQNFGAGIGYPIGYACIGVVTRLLGTDPIAARLFPAVIGILTIPIIYWIARKQVSHRAGVFAAVLLALSSYHLFYSQFARYYTLMLLFGLAGMWLAWEGVERNDKRRLAGAVAALGLAALTHWSALLLLPALALYALWAARGPRPTGWNARNLALLFGPFVLGGALAAPRLVGFLAAWSSPEGFSAARAGLALLKVADRMDFAILILAAVGGWLLARWGDRRGKWMICFGVVPSLLTVLFIGFSEGGSRFAFVALPGFVLLAAWLLDFMTSALDGVPRRAAWALAALVIVSMGIKDISYFAREHGQRPRWAEAAVYALGRPECEIVTNAPTVIEYYAQRQGRQRKVASLADAEAPGAGKPRLWVIEMTGNVRPSATHMKDIERSAIKVAEFPLRVRLLDYGIVVFEERSRSESHSR